LENIQGSLQPGIRGSNSETWEKFRDGLGSNKVVHYSVRRGWITASEYVDRFSNQVHPMIKTLFPKYDEVFQYDNAPFTQVELFSYGLKHIKSKFNIFPDHNIHQILILLNDWSVLEKS
jgi:hypothetical protein